MNKSGLRREHILTGASLSRSIKPTAVALAVAACFSGAALANPVNPTVVHGTATFQQAGNILNITNSANAIINWGSFSISVGELTRFIQPSALSAVLNRVTGQDPSAILGALQSNGRVFLINPNGIVFGAGAQIDVAGLVASTLKMSNEDFLNNRMRFTDGVGAGSVVNQGQITGGSVYLVGNAVTNNGLITSPNGEVVLAAGNSVELVNPGTPNLRVEVVAADNEARNLGTISAEAGRIGIYAGLIHNSGTLNASSAVAEGGRILLKAKKDITLASTSVIDASGQGGGEIIAFADNNMYVDGVLNASAPVSGDGGFIETSGKNRVKVEDSVVITTAAAAGKTGTWLIDPNDFVIAAYGGGDISGSALGSLLNSNNVVIASTDGSGMYGGGNGDILVNDGISWGSDSSLTLTALRNVEVNEGIFNSGSGGLNLYAGWDGVSSSANPTLVPTVGNVTINAPINVGSAVKMSAGNDIQIYDSVIATGRSLSYGGSASITLTGRSVLINGMVTAQGEMGSNSDFVPGGHANIAVIAGVGGVTINSPLSAYGGAGGSYGGSAGVGGNAGVQVTSAGNVTIRNWVTSEGGDGSSGNGGNASVQLTSSNGSISVIDGGEVYVSGGQGSSLTGGSALVKLNAAQGIQVDGSEGSDVSAHGGYGSTGGSAIVELVNTGASSAITISNNANVYADGGDGPEGGTGGSALTTLISAGGIVMNTSAEAWAQGGNADYYSSSGAGGSGTLSMIANGSVQIEGAEGSATGGDGFAGGSGAVLVVAGGNINLSNGTDILYSSYGSSYYGTSGVASTVVSAGGDLTLSNIYSMSSGGVVGLAAGNNILVSNSSIYGNTGLSISALGNLSVTNQSYMSGGNGNAFVNTGGNVLVDQSTIHGNPDVFMQVGGVIDINGTLAYGGKIDASSPSTININFTSASGGFSVNGIAGLVYDAATNTGFFVNGAGASIGNGLNIVYSGTPPATLNIPTENLLVAMGESTKPPDPEKDKDVFEEIKDEKKKDAPVCR